MLQSCGRSGSIENDTFGVPSTTNEASMRTLRMTFTALGCPMPNLGIKIETIFRRLLGPKKVSRQDNYEVT